MTSNQTPGPNKFRAPIGWLRMVRCTPLLTTISLSASIDTIWSSTTEHGTLASGWERQGSDMGLPGSLLSASKYKCAKLTPPAAPARALQLPEVVARARRVAPKWSRPLRVQDHALEAAALGRPALEGPREVLVIREDARQGLGRTLDGSGWRFSCSRRVKPELPEDARHAERRAAVTAESSLAAASRSPCAPAALGECLSSP